jgi:hypothetical protein
MSDASGFTKLVPGFEFMQSLVKNAGAALPGIGQWVAPTLNPEEIDKRIEELRTVQFWLEQNTRMLGATIQALEVQRMTLSTLQTMNVQMEGLRDSLQIKMPVMPGLTPAAPAERPPVPQPEPAPEAASAPAPDADAAGAGAAADAASEAAPKPGLVDPMQWWSALTKQFTELATTAMKDTGTDAARTLASAMVKRSLDGSSAAPGTTAMQAAKPARKAATKARKPAAKNAAKNVAKKAAGRP